MSATLSKPALSDAVLAMEDDLMAVSNFAKTFDIIGTHHNMIDPGAVHVVAEAFERTVASLHARWDAAFRLAVEDKR